MSTQSYENHTQVVTGFHKVTLPLIILTLIGSVVNLVQSWGDHQRIYSASLIVVLTISVALTAFLARVFALKAQDRAIRAEENLRHFALTGKLLDPRLSVRQIVALRFAPDAEFVALARKAADESTPSKAIKQAVKNWRADEYRV
jgi:hypothetical protein